MNYQGLDELPVPSLVAHLPSMRVLHLNPAASRSWGYGGHAADRLTVVALLGGVDLGRGSRLGDGDGRVFTLAADVRLGDGSQRRHQFVVRSGFDEEPEIALLVGFDASEQVALLSEAQEDARRLRALVDSNFDAYYDWHIAGAYHEWSMQMDALLGLAPGALPNTLETWIERLHPAQRDAVVRRLWASVDTGNHYEDEYLLRREDGQYRLVADRGTFLIDEEGHPSHLVGVIRDITQERAAQRLLQESEQLYRTLFQAAANPALRTDGDGRCIDANPAASRLLGSSRERLLDTRIEEHFGGEAAGILERLVAVPAAGQQAVTVELRTGASVEHRSVMISVIPCPVGDVVTYFWLCTDVTDLRALNTALESSQASLRTQTRALEEYSVALRVILEQSRQERLGLQRLMRENIDRLVAPLIDRLEVAVRERPEAVYLDAIRQTLQEIANSPGAVPEQAADPMQGALTRREVEVARLVKMGKSTDEIADILHVSAATVSYHRKMIRSKFGLRGDHTRLETYLLGPAGYESSAARSTSSLVPADAPAGEHAGVV
jgi:PAS domain S-box-containing protein